MKRILATVGILAVAVFAGYIYLCHVKAGGPASNRRTPPNILQKNDSEAVKYDSDRHEVIIQTPAGTKVEYARNPTIHERKDGSIAVSRNLVGFECAPVGGIGYSDRFRLYGGVAFAYAWRLDVQAMGAFTTDRHFLSDSDFILALSYNFFRNTSVFVGENPVRPFLQQPPEIHAGLTVRF